MKTNLAQKQQLLDKIEFLSTEQISNVLQFVDSLANLKDNYETKKLENKLEIPPHQETNFDETYKSWQPCDPLDAIEKLTLLLETDKLNNNDTL